MSAEPAAKRSRTESQFAVIDASEVADRVDNPIRKLVQEIDLKVTNGKEFIPLSIGDPTYEPNEFRIAEVAKQAMKESIEQEDSNGYLPSFGKPSARAAIAEKYSTKYSKVEADDVIIASGCSGALDMCIAVLANPGDNILCPRPGFSLYKTLAYARGIETKYYDCKSTQNWEVDIESLTSQIDERTKAIVITNPSNPCGSNFSEAHVKELLAVASKKKVPIIADEIYADMVFSGQKHTAIASLDSDVPILSCGGLAKRWLIPGWRVGWIVIHNRSCSSKEGQGVFDNVKNGLISLSQLILGACSIVQSVIPKLINETPDSYHEMNNRKLEYHATIFYELLSKCSGLAPVRAQGAMYLMCEIKVEQFKDIKNDTDFVAKLIKEESVFPLPGSVFQANNFVRVVVAISEKNIRESSERIREFCDRHIKDEYRRK